MSKVDDMRRQREERVAESARKATSAPKRVVDEAPKVVTTPPVIAAEPATTSPGDGDEKTEARCPECGKTKPLANGVMASHQHGFGKQCPGSRKPPA